MRTALARFDFRSAAIAVWQIVEEANRYVEATAPWHLARAERAGDKAVGRRLDQVLGALLAACQVLAAEIWPFLPDLAARVAAACQDFGGRLPQPKPVFPRIDVLPDGEVAASTGPGSTGPGSTGPGSTGPARTGPAHEREGGRQYPAVAGGPDQDQRRAPRRPKVSEVA